MPARAPEKRRLWRALVRLLGPALLVALIVKMPDRAAILRALTSATVWPLVVVFVLNMASCELKVWRWLVFLRTRGITYSIGRARAAYYASTYVGMLTPGRVGDVLRVQYLRAEVGAPYAEGLASVAMDRICDLYVLAAFVAFALVRYGEVLGGSLGRIVWALVAAVILGPLLVLVPGVADRVAKLVFKRFLPDKSESFAQFFEAMRANVGRSLVATIPLTIGAFLVNYVQGYLLAMALHLDLSFVDATCLLAIASLLGLLPISVSGLGVREALYAVLLPAIGHRPEDGVTLGLVVFVTMYMGLVLIGLIAYLSSPPPSSASPTPLDMNDTKK